MRRTWRGDTVVAGVVRVIVDAERVTIDSEVVARRAFSERESLLRLSTRIRPLCVPEEIDSPVIPESVLAKLPILFRAPDIALHRSDFSAAGLEARYADAVAGQGEVGDVAERDGRRAFVVRCQDVFA